MSYEHYNGGGAKVVGGLLIGIAGVCILMNIVAMVVGIINSYGGAFIGAGIFVSGQFW